MKIGVQKRRDRVSFTAGKEKTEYPFFSSLHPSGPVLTDTGLGSVRGRLLVKDGGGKGEECREKRDRERRGRRKKTEREEEKRRGERGEGNGGRVV